MIAASQTNGGKLNSSHKEFSNGYVFAVLEPGMVETENYVPVTFTVMDIFGECSDVVIGSGDVYHAELMRRDGGWSVKNDSVTPTFDFRELEKITLGVSKSPSGEVIERYGYGLYDGQDYALDGLTINKTVAWREDRTFWDPGKTIQNETGQPDLFGFTQTDPRSCVHNVLGCKKCDTPDSWEYRLEEHRIMTEDRK